MRFGFFCLSLLALNPVSAASEIPADNKPPSQEELEKWFEDDTPPPDSNLGELAFLDALPTDKPTHHHQNWVSITPSSLQDGWVQLKQCHQHLDQVSKLQITFREGHVRNLQVTETHNTGKAWVEGPSVQIRDIRENAKVCLQAQTQAFKKTGDIYYSLNNGPYMRKFLDGYFPMHVSMQVSYPETLLQIVSIAPEAQSGFKVSEETGQISFDAMFEGELRTNIQFQQTVHANNPD